MFLVLLLFIISIYFTTTELSEGKLLNRDQTEEWKGWMQVMFVWYHYFRAYETYNAVRIYIAAYVWMTGFGEFCFVCCSPFLYIPCWYGSVFEVIESSHSGGEIFPYYFECWSNIFRSSIVSKILMMSSFLRFKELIKYYRSGVNLRLGGTRPPIRTYYQKRLRVESKVLLAMFTFAI